MHRPRHRAREKPEKALITSVFSNITFNFEFTRCYEGVKIIRLLSCSN